MPVSYCTHCGQPAQGGDTFCVACGRRLRQSQEKRPPEPGMEGARPANAQFLAAVQHLKERRPAEAARALEAVCAEDPGWAVARAYLGIAYLRCSRVADARESLEAAVSLDPASFICHAKFGEFLARLGFYDQALTQLDLALELPSPDPESRYAALELRQFAKERSKGLFYRRLEFPSFRAGRTLLTRHGRGAVSSHAPRSA